MTRLPQCKQAHDGRDLDETPRANSFAIYNPGQTGYLESIVSLIHFYI